jgi:hypothetical protein
MKRIAKVFVGLVIVLILLGSCNRYVVCSAYADQEAATEQNDVLPS